MQIILSPKANFKMTYYILGIDYEISGLGIVEKLPGQILYVPDIYLLEQEVTGATTDLNPRDVAKFIDAKMIDETFPLEKLKLWWHSHVNMDTFWSGTDVATINSLDTDQSEENWWLSIVGNKSGKRLARLDVYQPHRLTLQDIPIDVIDEELKSEVDKEIKEKVKVRHTGLPPGSTSIPVYNSTNKRGISFMGYEYDNQKGFFRPNNKTSKSEIEEVDYTKPIDQPLKAGKNRIVSL